MPAFEYTAIRRDGAADNGVLLAKTAEEASARLAEQGLSRVTVKPAGTPIEQPRPSAAEEFELKERSVIAAHVIGPAYSGVSMEALQFFFRQLGVMLNAGVNPVQAVDTLARSTSCSKLKQILGESSRTLQEGLPFTFVFERYPEVFTPMMIGLIKAGEEGGFLSNQCMLISDYLRDDIELRNLIRRETFYPKAIIGASVLIVIAANGIIAAVAPGAQGLSSPLTNPVTWIFLTPAIILGWLFITYGLRVPAVRRFVDAMYLVIPGIRGMAHGFALAKFGRAFGALYRGGIPLQKAVRLAGDACGNEEIRARVHTAERNLDSGMGVTEAMRQTNAFSPIVLDLLHTGEMTGELDQMLIRFAEYYEDEGKTRARQSATLVGVFAFLLVAAYVGYMIVSFYTGFAGGRVSG
jgi:type IV pilus assembly protein PilC/MSHA biogenesis protein MshG